jgi:hypothetical protein
MIEYAGLWVLIALTINMWALLSVLGAEASWLQKVIWAIGLLIPLFGFVAWYLFGPRQKTA